MVALVLTPEQFFELGMDLIGVSQGTTKAKITFIAHYGATPLVQASIWEDLHRYGFISAKANPTHFLWGLHLLKCYKTGCVLSSFTKSTKELAEKWAWYYIRAMRRLKQHKIKWPVNWGATARIFATIDGVHCRTQELKGFNQAMWSHKFNAAAFAYELVISIHTNECLAINGPFHATNNDLQMYNSRTRDMVPDGFFLLGDRFYQSAAKVTTIHPDDSQQVKDFKKRALSRHETFNKRIKQFEILNTPFRAHRHKMAKHKDAFEAVCVITQYAIESEMPLFDV